MNTVQDLMTKPLQTIHRDKLVCEVAGILGKENISGAPIVDDDDQMVGIVSKSDIVRFEYTGGDPFVAHVWEIAQPKIVTVEAGAGLKEAAELMLAHHLHRLLVVSEGKPVGILSSFDFVRLKATS